MKFPRVALTFFLYCTAAAFAQSLPPAVAETFVKANVPLENVAVVVKEIGSKDAVLTLNADKSMNPASVI